MIHVRSYRFWSVGIFLATVAVLSSALCKADEKVLLGLVEEAMKENPDELDPIQFIAAKIRQHYGKDEATLLRDAMDLAAGESGYATILLLLADVEISPVSRLSLVEQIVTAKDEAAASRASLVLSKCDQAHDGNGTDDLKPDISRHRAWLKKGEALPAEYATYLYTLNGKQAWEYLGSGDTSNPQVKILSRLDGLLLGPDPMANRKQWIEEILPQFAGELSVSNPYDAAYLASFIGRNNLLLATTNANPKLVEALEKALQGYGALLMRKEGGKPTRTKTEEANRWLATARDRIPAK